MKQIILSIFVGISALAHAQSDCKSQYVIEDSIAAKKENQAAPKYLASYVHLLDSVDQLLNKAGARVMSMKEEMDSLRSDWKKSYTTADSGVTHKKAEKKAVSSAKKEGGHRETVAKILNNNEEELASLQAQIVDWRDIYRGISYLARIRMRHLVGPSYDQVVEGLCIDGVFILQGKVIYSAKYLPLE